MDFASLFPRKKPDIGELRQRKDLQGLIGALRFPDVTIQKEAASALCTFGPDAAGALLTALKTSDRIGKLGIIEALGKIRETRAVEPLIACLTDESNEVRWVAAIALGEIEDSRATEPLSQALKDPDKYVRYGAAFALSRIGWKPRDQTERAFYFLGFEEWRVLKEIGAPSIPALANAMKDRDAGVRLKVLDTLGELRCRDAEPIVLKALSDADSDVRWKAVLTSQKIGIPPVRLPRWLAIRPRNRKNPLVAGFLNFMLPGLGYGYLGRWWGIMVFQIDVTVTIWIFKFWGELNTYSILFPVYLLIGIHAWYLARKMPEMPA
ncbi:MAG: PBS lyase HEAT-like repeat protein [Methanoregula sp. PtaU1.Bin051]|nr:MAG: PBS lyase HEAT-like repeat protein [Methanoregula sp. PtaU1.Bin051]